MTLLDATATLIDFAKTNGSETDTILAKSIVRMEKRLRLLQLRRAKTALGSFLKSATIAGHGKVKTLTCPKCHTLLIGQPPEDETSLATGLPPLRQNLAATSGPRFWSQKLTHPAPNIVKVVVHSHQTPATISHSRPLPSIAPVDPVAPKRLVAQTGRAPSEPSRRSHSRRFYPHERSKSPQGLGVRWL